MKSFRTKRGPFQERPYYTSQEIEQICSDELQSVGLLPTGPETTRIERFIEKRFRLTPAYEDLPPGMLGYTLFGATGPTKIVVAGALAEEGTKPAERRINTTLAHEAGHCLLHGHLFAMDSTPMQLFGDAAVSSAFGSKILCRDDQRRSAYDGKWWEYQANQAIAGLLLPRRLVEQVAEHFLAQGKMLLPVLVPSARNLLVRQHELPEIFSKKNPDRPPGEEQRKSYATQDVYDGYLRKWILPRWKSYRLMEVKAVDVEKWLKNLCFPNGIPLAKGTKAKVRNIMSALYSHAIRWEWAERNPITSVRQSAKRQRTPEILTIEEVVNLLSAIPEPFRTAVFLDGSSGLRVGELLGLKWDDVDLDKNVIHIRRSIVKQKVGPPKTEASQKPIPMDAELANSLWLWKQETPYNGPSD